MDIIIIRYFGLVFDLAYQKCKNSCTYTHVFIRIFIVLAHIAQRVKPFVQIPTDPSNAL